MPQGGNGRLIVRHRPLVGAVLTQRQRETRLDARHRTRIGVAARRQELDRELELADGGSSQAIEQQCVCPLQMRSGYSFRVARFSRQDQKAFVERPVHQSLPDDDEQCERLEQAERDSGLGGTIGPVQREGTRERGLEDRASVGVLQQTNKRGAQGRRGRRLGPSRRRDRECHTAPRR